MTQSILQGGRVRSHNVIPPIRGKKYLGAAWEVHIFTGERKKNMECRVHDFLRLHFCLTLNPSWGFLFFFSSFARVDQIECICRERKREREKESSCREDPSKSILATWRSSLPSLTFEIFFGGFLKEVN